MRKMWAIMLYLSRNQWTKKEPEMTFEDTAWDEALKAAAEAGLNTILLDVGDGVRFGSHPELEIKGAWSRKRVKAELRKAAGMGLTIIPKLNFSALHDPWLGEYGNMVSTSAYYRVCRNLIHEVYDLFEQPEYIHLGLDEEDEDHIPADGLAVFRRGGLIWHDLRFFVDTVHETGATPWIWSDFLFRHPEDFRKHIGCDELILSPWMYNAVRREHWTPISSRPVYVEYYNSGKYKAMNLTYVEEDPFIVRFMEQAMPGARDGYRYVPCVSTVNCCPYNTQDMVEYFRNEAPDEGVVGFITAPWKHTRMENMDEIRESIRLLKEAKEMFYPEHDGRGGNGDGRENGRCTGAVDEG